MTRKTPEQVRAILDYDPETGVLTWKRRDADQFNAKTPGLASAVAGRWEKFRAGKTAGHTSATGYVTLCIERRTYQAHRIAWAIIHGAWPDGEIDHINHDKVDNRLCNLRVVTPVENARNKSRAQNNSSGATGVHFHTPSGKWHARINADDGRRHIGAFPTKREAERARARANAQHGYHENHGAR